MDQPPVYPPAGARSQSSSRNHAATASRAQSRTVAVIATLVLLAVVGPMVYVLWKHSPQFNTAPPPSPVTTIGHTATAAPKPSPTATPNATATAQAAASATAQANKQATATAQARATATAQAQASATAGVILTATAGTPIYQDKLTDPNNQATQNEQWDQKGQCTFQADGYHVTSGTALQGCHESATQYTNATFSVDLSIISGHAGGLFFYLNPDTFGAYAGYLFEVDTQGHFQIEHAGNYSTGSNMVVMQAWTPSPALKTGASVKNTLQVIAHNGTLLFYINGTFVSQQQDTTFTSGSIGFLASKDPGGQDADVVYSNVAVYQRAK